MGLSGLVVRLLMLVACLVPLTSMRQASAAVSASAFADPLPTPVGGCEEESESDTNEVLRGSQSPERVGHAPPRATIRHSRHARVTTPIPAPVPADPFRNGLGTPYRC